MMFQWPWGETHKQITQPALISRTIVNEQGFHDVSLPFQQNWARALYNRRSQFYAAWLPEHASSGWIWYQGNQPRNRNWGPAPITYVIRRPIYPLTTRQGQMMGARPTQLQRGVALQQALQQTMARLYGSGVIFGGGE